MYFLIERKSQGSRGCLGSQSTDVKILHTKVGI